MMTKIEYDYLVFLRDDKKNKINPAKHGIAFEDAVPVFFNDYVLTQSHSIVEGEQRWRTLGRMKDTVILFIGHLIYDDEMDREVIRIITVRQATPTEEKIYYGHY